MKTALLILLLVIGAALPAAAQQSPIGFVKTMSGSATVQREGVRLLLRAGVPLYEHDLIETGADGQLGITFRDNSRIALGSGTRVAVSRFAFKPAQRQYGLIMQLLHGTLGYISGLTAKLAPDSVSIETPTSTIAVRGTRFLARAE